jgi:hypothetical protein
MRKGSTYFRVRSAVRALVVSGVAVLPFYCLAPGENTSPPTLPLDVSLCSAPCGLTSLHADVFAQVEAREPLCFNWHTCKPPPRRAYRGFLRKGPVTGYGGIASSLKELKEDYKGIS